MDEAMLSPSGLPSQRGQDESRKEEERKPVLLYCFQFTKKERDYLAMEDRSNEDSDLCSSMSISWQGPFQNGEVL